MPLAMALKQPRIPTSLPCAIMHCSDASAPDLDTNMPGPGRTDKETSLIPKKPQGFAERMTMATAFTARGASSNTVSLYDVSPLVAVCHPVASSKLPPSMLVKMLNSPGLYAQLMDTAETDCFAFRMPVQVTRSAGAWFPALHQYPPS